MFKKILLIALASSSVFSYAENIIDSAQPTVQPTPTPSQYSKNNSFNSTQENNPNVNSRLYSGAQFTDQNDVTGQKGVKYNASREKNQNDTDKSAFSKNNSTEANNANSPTVNSRLYSGSQFPQQNQVTGTKKQRYYTKEQRKNKVNNPNVNSRLYSGAQFPQQNNFGKKKPAASSAQ